MIAAPVNRRCRECEALFAGEIARSSHHRHDGWRRARFQLGGASNIL